MLFPLPRNEITIQKNARITTNTATHTPARDALDKPPAPAAPLESAALDWPSLDGAGVGNGEGKKGALVGAAVGVLLGGAVDGLEDERWRDAEGEVIVVEPAGLLEDEEEEEEEEEGEGRVGRPK